MRSPGMEFFYDCLLGVGLVQRFDGDRFPVMPVLGAFDHLAEIFRNTVRLLSAHGMTAERLHSEPLPRLTGIEALVKDRDDLRQLRGQA